MKKTFFSFAFISLTTLLFLSSCATYQKDIFAKRKYYNFPRTKHIISNPSEELTTINTVKPVLISSETNTTNSEEKITNTLSASTNQNTPAITKKEIMPKASQVPAITILEIKETPHAVSSHTRNTLNKTIESHSSSSDGMFILEIILAVLLPPLGIYIKNNNAVNKWFWITLILCLLGAFGWGFMVIGLGGVLWFAAAIIALLFVFDAI